MAEQKPFDSAVRFPKSPGVTPDQRLGWEVRGGPSMDQPREETYSVERGTTAEGNREVAALYIQDYGLACVIEAAMNFREGIVD